MTRWPLLLFVALALGGATGCDPSGAAGVAAPQVATVGRVRETTFDDITFEMESNDQFNDELITPAIKQRFGNRIRIRGYMFPTLRESGLKQFVLVRDNLECCFGPGAALYDCVLVYMREGVTATYSVRPVTVTGDFIFDKLAAGPDGPILAIYRLDDAVVE